MFCICGTVEHCVKKMVLRWSPETFSVQSLPFPSLLPQSVCIPRKLSLDVSFPTVKAWRTSAKHNRYFKGFVELHREAIDSKENHTIIWWSLIGVLKFHGKHLCNKDNNVSCQEMCLWMLLLRVLYYCSFPQDNLKISWFIFHRSILHLKYLLNLCRLVKVILSECF